jgi:hypothetical protein
MNYYHVRLSLLSGTMLDGYACLGLAKSVAMLSQLTGKQWPYQVINRALKKRPCWAHAYEQPAVTAPAGKPHAARCVVVSIEDAGQNPYPELLDSDEAPPLGPVAAAPRVTKRGAPTTQPFTLLLEDAALIAMWVPEIIEKGVSKRDAPVFERLEKTLLHQLKLANYEPYRRG